MRRVAAIIIAPLILALTSGCSTDQPSNAQSIQEVAKTVASVGLAGRVTDAAHVLSADEKSGIAAKLEALEKATRHQVVVVTVPSLAGQEVGDYTRKLANSWGIGRKGYNDGVVLLVAPNEHKVRISVGYGLEQTLPNALCQTIIDEQMIPHFRLGDWAGGIDAGVNALISRLGYPPPPVDLRAARKPHPVWR